LLAKESVEGSLKEIHDSMEKDLKTGSILSQELQFIGKMKLGCLGFVSPSG